MKKYCFLIIACSLFVSGVVHSRLAPVAHQNPRMPYYSPAQQKGVFSVEDLKFKKSFYIYVMRYILYKELVEIYEKLGNSNKFAKCTKRMNKYFNKLVQQYQKSRTRGKDNILNEVLNSAKNNLSNILPVVSVGK